MERKVYYIRAWVWNEHDLSFWPERKGSYKTPEEAETAFEGMKLTSTMPRIELWTAKLNKYLCEEEDVFLRGRDRITPNSTRRV